RANARWAQVRPDNAVTSPSEALDRNDIALVAACLPASDEGPFFPDWEFQTLFGGERSQFRDVRRRWPDVSLAERTVSLSIMNAMANLIGYPHGEERALLQYVPEGRDRLLQLADKLKRLRKS